MATETTVVSVIMGSLQVIGLFLPVVVLTTRFVIQGLEPREQISPAEKRDRVSRQKRLAKFSIILIALLSASAAVLILQMLLAFDLPVLVILGLGMLAGGFVGFGLALRDAAEGTSRMI
jgi:hypothetical protein